MIRCVEAEIWMQLSNTESNKKMAYTKSPEEDDLLPRCPLRRAKARESRRKERKTRTQKITCKEKEERGFYKGFIYIFEVTANTKGIVCLLLGRISKFEKGNHGQHSYDDI